MRPTLLVGLALTAVDPGGLTDRVRTAESIGLNLLLLDDGPGQPAAPHGRGNLDPVESAAFAAAITGSIALVATAAATHAEPYHLSNRLSSLDWGSSGRAGWLVTVDATPARAEAYSAVPPAAETAVGEAAAVLDAVRRLWDSWEDGALIADTPAGRFLDQEKLHYVDVHGEFFSLRGPALMPRPPQGRLVVLARAADGISGADVVLVEGRDAGELVRAAELARAAGAQRVVAEAAWDGAGDLAGLLRDLAPHLDGVVLRGADPAPTLDALAAALPALAADGVVVPPSPGQTLREQFGLARPVSCYAVEAPAIPALPVHHIPAGAS